MADLPADRWGLQRPIYKTEEYRNNEFWKKKMSYCFDFVDLDNSGVLTKEDQELWVKLTLAQRKKTTPEEEQRFREATYAGWTGVFGGKEGVPVTKKQFMLSLSEDCQAPGFLDMQDQISDKWFGTLDEDHNGSISWAEFYNFHKGLGRVNEAEARKCFEALDTDGDNTFSKKEWFDMVHGFFFGLDPKSPTRFMWGDFDAADAKGIDVPEL